jgi:hypothetical protein
MCRWRFFFFPKLLEELFVLISAPIQPNQYWPRNLEVPKTSNNAPALLTWGIHFLSTASLEDHRKGEEHLKKSPGRTSFGIFSLKI